MHGQKGEYRMRVSHFIISFLLLVSAAQAYPQTFSFKMQNNTGLNFENGAFLIEVVEISLQSPQYVKVNMTSGVSSRFNNLYDGETPITFNQVKLNSSYITSKDAIITIEFPAGWGYPKSYKIELPVVPVGIPNLVITKSADKTNLNSGDIVSFTIKVENTGNATANNISLIERLPTGFSVALGKFPPVISERLDAGESTELDYQLKAIEPGNYSIEPTIIKYGPKTSRSGQISLTVAPQVLEKSNLTTVMIIDRTNVYTDDLIKADVRVTNTGKADAKSIVLEGTPPLGLKVVEGDLRQVYSTMAPGEVKEYRVVFKAQEEGNYSINLRTVYNDDPTGSSMNSEPITVTRKEGNNLFIIMPVIFVIAGVVIFTIKRHKEYSY